MADQTVADLKRVCWTNICLLNITAEGFKSKYNLELNRDSFEVPNPSVLSSLLYEMATLLDEKLLRKSFKEGLKPTGKLIESEFRKNFISFVENAKQNYPDYEIPDMPGNLIINFHKKNLYNFLAKLSTSVLRKNLAAETDVNCCVPVFSFEDGYSHKMFVESFSESCQKYCLLKLKKIMKWSSYYEDLKKTYSDIVEDLENNVSQVVSRMKKADASLASANENQDYNLEYLKTSTESLSKQLNEDTNRLKLLSEKILNNQPFMDNLNSNLNSDCNTTVLSKTIQVNDTVDLDFVYENAIPVLQKIDGYLNEVIDSCVNNPEIFNLSNWEEFKCKHTKFLGMLNRFA